jgi:hypothetical protein
MKLIVQLVTVYTCFQSNVGIAFTVTTPFAFRNRIATQFYSSRTPTDGQVWLQPVTPESSSPLSSSPSSSAPGPLPPPFSPLSTPGMPDGSQDEMNSYIRSETYFSNSKGRSTLEAAGTIRPAPMFPRELSLERIEGVKTVRNFKIPPWAERAQYILTTNGRPMKATVELWVGPIRKTHTLEINVENGRKTPVRGTLKFKKGTEVITIRTSDAGELPLSACVVVPSEERAKEIQANTEKIWKSNKKTKIQGGIIQPNGKSTGAVRYFPIPPEVDAVQLLFWSKDTGKKSLKAKIEILKGPNNVKQSYDLQCGGGSQPYHAVFETGGGGVIRIINKKFMEDGLFEVAVVPIQLEGTPYASDDDEDDD